MVKRGCEDDSGVVLGRRLRESTEIGFRTRDFGKSAAEESNSLCRSHNNLIRYWADAHLLSFGITGSGKGRSLIVPNLISSQEQIVCLDPKQGELFQITSSQRKQMGSQVILLDPFGVTGEPSDGLCPLDCLHFPGAELTADSETIASVLASASTNARGYDSKERFWEASGTGLLSGIISYVGTLPQRERTMSKVVNLLLSDDVTYNLAVLMDTVGDQIPAAAHREIAAFLQMPDVTRGGVLATAQSYVKTLHSPGVLNCLDKTTFSLMDFVAGKPMTLYVVMPVERLISHREVIKLWMATLLKALLLRSFRPLNPTLFLLDELGQLGSFPFLESFVTLCRSFSCRVWGFFQDLAQLQACYPDSWKTIMHNCGLQVLGFPYASIAEQWAPFLNVSTNELLNLPTDQMMVALPHQRPQRIGKLDYLRDDLFSGMFASNPLYEEISAEEIARRLDSKPSRISQSYLDLPVSMNKRETQDQKPRSDDVTK